MINTFLFILKLIAITLILNNIIILVFSVLTSLVHLYRKNEFRFAKGYNLHIFFQVGLYTILSIVLIYRLNLKYEEIVISPKFTLIQDFILLLIVIILISVLVINKRPYSIFKLYSYYFDSQTTNEDLLEPKKNEETINSNINVVQIFHNNVKNDNSDQGNLESLFKPLTPEEVLKIIEEYKPDVTVNNLNRKKIIDFASNKYVEFPIELNVTKYSTDTLNKKPLVKFLSEILLIKEVWGKKETQESVVNYVNSKFLIKSDKLKGEINRSDFMRYLSDK